ncbi:MAG: GNAT family N-acetyltransferase [Mailhella sp.]|nr:GNAT family N-acetyltransferase [Mailhella sp.]
MNLREEAVSAGFADRSMLAELNDEAFPPEERLPADLLLSASEDGKLLTTALYEGWRFVGFYTVRESAEAVYLCYLAVSPGSRGHGIGSEALRRMRERFAGRQIVLDLERTDVPAANSRQRASRLRFYKRSGFFETGYYLRYLGLDLALLCSEPHFEAAAFRRLLDAIDAPGVDFILSRDPWPHQKNGISVTQ